MRAVCWEGKGKIRVDTVPDPKILNPRDAIIKVTSTAICGSDLHLYDGYIPTMEKGDILGHEFMGEVVELGSSVKNLAVGDRVVVPFAIACGRCFFCQKGLWSCCDNSNPNAWMAETAYGMSAAALFGYSHMFGGYAGGQAEYARVPFADVGPLKVTDGLSDEQVLFLTDIFPDRLHGGRKLQHPARRHRRHLGLRPGRHFAIRSAFLLGAERVIAIDHIPSRLRLAEKAGAETIDFDNETVFDEILAKTGGRGADSCIDAVGLEAHGHTIGAAYDQIKAKLGVATDRITAVRQAIQACRKGGTVSLPGVYGGLVDKFPLGAAFSKGLTFRMGQTHVHRYLKPLMERIEQGSDRPDGHHQPPLEAGGCRGRLQDVP